MPVKSEEQISPCELSLDIEVESAKVAEAVDKAYREFSKYVAVPGFRKGKAPLSFVKQRVPADQVRERTAELLVQPAYEQAITEKQISPYARPRMELVKLETTPPDYVFEFKAIVPLAPKVELGDYKGIEAKRVTLVVDDEMINRQIEDVRSRHADFPLVEDRTSQLGDVIVGDLSITPREDDAEIGPDAELLIEPEEFRPTAITLGDPGNVPGVDEQLVGLSVGDEKSFKLPFPADYPNEEVAGKNADFIIRVKEMHARILPELNDEFAKKAGRVDTLDAWKAKLRSEFEETYRSSGESIVESDLVDKLVELSTINYPSILLDLELEDDIKTFNEELESRKITFPEYLANNNTTEEELLEKFRSQAERRLRRGLVLGELARQEGLELKDEDIAAEIEDRAAKQRTSVQSMRAYIDSSGGMEAIRNAAYTKKLIGHLKSLSNITDEILDTAAVIANAKKAQAKAETDAAEKPAKKPSTRKKKAVVAEEASEPEA